MKKAKPILITGIVFLAISIIFTILITKIDVSTGTCEPSCPSCADCRRYYPHKIGFSRFNKAIFEAFPYNNMLYKATNYIGYIPILCAGAYCIFGLVQLIKRKSIKKVDKGLFALAGLFIVTLACYFLFEKLAINYRPVMIDGEFEASYPSSHTLITICLSFGIILLNRIAYSDKKPLKYLNMALAFLTAFIVAGRFFSGVHWATDIIGGLLIATSYILIYHATLLKIYDKHDKIKETKQGKKK